MNYLQDIARLYAEGNLSGLVDIKVASKADFESIPLPVNGVIYGDVVFKSGKGWSTWFVTMDSASVKGAPQLAREGVSKNNSLDFTISKDQAVKRQMLDLAQRDELIVLFKDGNGQKKLFGQLHAPVHFQYSADSGANIGASFNGYACRFYFEGVDNIFFYAGAVSVPVGPAPAVVKFNGVPIATLSSGQQINIISDFAYTDFFIS